MEVPGGTRIQPGRSPWIVPVEWRRSRVGLLHRQTALAVLPDESVAVTIACPLPTWK
jgi:hypothetical protein